jgi:DNA-binding MarR family transcriptional regulator
MHALRKIIQIIDLNSRRLVKRVGLTGPQLVILKEICRAEAVSAGTIAKAVSLSSATVTGILERMENRGLVSRGRDHQDRRRVMVRATDAGRRVVDRAPPLMQEAIVEQFEGLPDWEQTMILSSLQHLVAIMENRSQDSAACIAPTAVAEAETPRPPEQ